MAARLTYRDLVGKALSAPISKLVPLIAVVLAILLFGCSSGTSTAPAAESKSSANPPAQAPATKSEPSEKPSSSPQQSPPEKLKKITVGYPTQFPALFDAQVFMAREMNVYQQYGLEVEFVFLRGDDLTFKALQAGQFDFSNQANAVVYIAREAGSDVKAFIESSPTLNWALVTQKDINTPKDFEGRSLAVSQPGNVSHIVPMTFLKLKGVDTSKVQVVPIGTSGARAQALVAGKVDGSALFVENALDLVKQDSLKIFAYTADLLPFQFGTWVAKADVLQKRRDEAVRFSAAILDTVERIRKDRKPVIDYYAQLYKMDPQIITQAFDIYMKSGHYPTDGGMYAESLKLTAQSMVETGDLKQVPRYDDVYDTSIVRDAMALVKEKKK